MTQSGGLIWCAGREERLDADLRGCCNQLSHSQDQGLWRSALAARLDPALPA